MCKEESSPLLAPQKPIKKYIVDIENVDKGDDSNTKSSSQETKEDWKCWIIVVAAFYSMFILNGAEYSFGCLMEPLMKQTGLARSAISIAGSTQVALSAFTAPLASFMINKMGTRKVSAIGCVLASIGLLGASFATEIVGVFTGLSVLAGSGFGLMYMPAMVAVAENFNARRSLALGLSLCGPAAGQIVLSPVMNWLTEEYGWKGCLRVLSGLCAVCIVVGSVLRQPKKQNTIIEQKLESIDDDLETLDHERPVLALVLGYKLSRNQYVWVFVLLMFADAFSVMALFIPYGYIQPVAAMANIPSHLASLLISAIGLGSIMGRLSSSLLTGQPWCEPLHLIRSSVALVSILPLVLTVVDKFWMFATCCFMFGFLTGLWIASTSPFLVKLLGVHNINKALGLLTFVQGAASLISPPMAGVSVELSGDPLMALYLSAGLLMFSATIYSTAIVVLNKKKNRLILYDRLYTQI